MEFESQVTIADLRAELHALLEAKMREAGEFRTQVRVLEVRLQYLQEEHDATVHRLEMQHSATYANGIAKLQESLQAKGRLITLLEKHVASLVADGK